MRIQAGPQAGSLVTPRQAYPIEILPIITIPPKKCDGNDEEIEMT
jgi:hypothetical protein